MQAAAAPWRAVLRTTHLLVAPTRLAASSFHSTPVSSGKWKDKFDCKHEHGARKLSKNYERYVVRQRRAEGKKALKDYLLYGKSSPHLQGGSTGSFANSHDIPRFKTFRKGSQSHGSTKSRQGKKDRERFNNFFREEYYVHPDKIFEDMTGESKRERVCSDSDDESEDDTSETTNIGSHAHRAILGLPPCGPLTLDAVKIAFRASALRWHPDKHPGSSQAVAGEKFKLCVNAYNSLCNVLKAA
uniref:J domain-containing protein n=1 Tax=Oryza punctata TaxID=4537 RepID=A0A0E0KX43_ORYPU